MKRGKVLLRITLSTNRRRAEEIKLLLVDDDCSFNESYASEKYVNVNTKRETLICDFLREHKGNVRSMFVYDELCGKLDMSGRTFIRLLKNMDAKNILVYKVFIGGSEGTYSMVRLK
jgi:hypothetical protein